jgi:N-acetylglucosamine-6-phosphate deacetylase
MNATKLPDGSPVRLERSEAGWRCVAADAAPTDVWVGPAWIDIQVNGFAGIDVNDPATEPAAFAALTRALRAGGVTRYLPTVITGAPATMAACLRNAARAGLEHPGVARAIAGLHLEGPFIAPRDGPRGAHPAEHVRPADPMLFDDLQAAAEGRIALVTLAPEVPGALALTASLTAAGIVVAIGHSDAEPALVAEAVAAGARLSTHLGNGTAALLPRHDNVIWSQLAEPRLLASVIFDGHHLPASLMRVFYAVKGPDALILISDAVALAGRPPGVYHQAVGGEVELHPNGRLTLRGTPYLAGSVSTVADGVANALRHAGASPAAAWAMASATPARLLRLPERDDLTVARIDETGVTVIDTVVDDAGAA